ncbi:MAG: hypothetical protein IT290_09455 [Deltaproteobacteria bacterium]|nr:hypothetical protein [Deltaproteobacteria bacterium]
MPPIETVHSQVPTSNSATLSQLLLGGYVRGIGSAELPGDTRASRRALAEAFERERVTGTSDRPDVADSLGASSPEIAHQKEIQALRRELHSTLNRVGERGVPLYLAPSVHGSKTSDQLGLLSGLNSTLSSAPGSIPEGHVGVWPFSLFSHQGTDGKVVVQVYDHLIANDQQRLVCSETYEPPIPRSEMEKLATQIQQTFQDRLSMYERQLARYSRDVVSASAESLSESIRPVTTRGGLQELFDEFQTVRVRTLSETSDFLGKDAETIRSVGSAVHLPLEYDTPVQRLEVERFIPPSQATGSTGELGADKFGNVFVRGYFRGENTGGMVKEVVTIHLALPVQDRADEGQAARNIQVDLSMLGREFSGKHVDGELFDRWVQPLQRRDAYRVYQLPDEGFALDPKDRSKVDYFLSGVEGAERAWGASPGSVLTDFVIVPSKTAEVQSPHYFQSGLVITDRMLNSTNAQLQNVAFHEFVHKLDARSGNALSGGAFFDRIRNLESAYPWGVGVLLNEQNFLGERNGLGGHALESPQEALASILTNVNSNEFERIILGRFGHMKDVLRSEYRDVLSEIRTNLVTNWGKLNLSESAPILRQLSGRIEFLNGLETR